MEAGKLFAKPPSSKSFPLSSMGSRAPGRDILALMASGKYPLSKTTASPVSALVATQAKGIASFEKSLISFAFKYSSCKTLSTFCPFTAPFGIEIFQFLIGTEIAYLSLSSLLSISSSSRAIESLKYDSQSLARIISSISLALYPIEYNPPIILPILVPTI